MSTEHSTTLTCWCHPMLRLVMGGGIFIHYGPESEYGDVLRVYSTGITP